MNQLALVTDGITKLQIQFVVPGVPVAKGRGKVTTIGGHARVITLTKTRDYESWVAQHARQAMGATPRLAGPLSMTLEFCLPVPESWSKKRKAAAVWHVIKPDLSNAWKAIEDACNGIVYVDDTSICEVHARKRYSDSPCVVVTVREIA